MRRITRPDPASLLQEVWRVLAPSGRVIIAVVARDGLWANAESTPFGHGRPYSRRQLAALLREAELEPADVAPDLARPCLCGIEARQVEREPDRIVGHEGSFAGCSASGSVSATGSVG